MVDRAKTLLCEALDADSIGLKEVKMGVFIFRLFIFVSPFNL
jgi:hypothetical protein